MKIEVGGLVTNDIFDKIHLNKDGKIVCCENEKFRKLPIQSKDFVILYCSCFNVLTIELKEKK